MGKFAVGISGASGIILGLRAVHVLAQEGHEVHLVVTSSACCTAVYEMAKTLNKPEKFVLWLPEELRERVILHNNNNFGAAIASGSFRLDGTLIAPCSMASLAAIAMGLSDNLLRRVADVAMKERRPLVIIPRETPLTETHLEHMMRISRQGGIIVPPMPSWYALPQTLADVENGIVGKALDALGVRLAKDIYSRWKGI